MEQDSQDKHQTKKIWVQQSPTLNFSHYQTGYIF